MLEVFLSHASKDHAKASRLRKLLVAHDIPVWFSPLHITGAQLWQDEIGAALARCDWFMILLTPDALQSMWVKRELNYALIDERFDGHIIPVLFKKCDVQSLSWTLPQIQMIDFTKDYSKACQQLLRIWDKTLKKPRRRKSRK
jgi:TIR domain